LALFASRFPIRRCVPRGRLGSPKPGLLIRPRVLFAGRRSRLPPIAAKDRGHCWSVHGTTTPDDSYFSN
jgi:hypothetical protein